MYAFGSNKLHFGSSGLAETLPSTATVSDSTVNVSGLVSGGNMAQY